ncbi:unnamed protein product [Acanthoscelides obtectus]|uniref:C-type lectin domain-containing protein n=1 Tax=Acanthoscelides obtectus TaxID=200917 RepID=A0A9P0PM49_ACAOB|nr:unnamed protein product [Acanthoscelides obtectus]CAK1642089.1 hypothetical protein AOBTE_LOCUS12828 [Acanthoscelides obtectus]
MDQEGTFLTALGNSLSYCSRYRAWAPGHPLKNDDVQDCVVLDSSRMWRTVDCRRPFPALCELYPEKPPDDILRGFTDVDCESIKNNAKKIICVRQKKLYEIYKNSSRADKCALENGIFGE